MSHSELKEFRLLKAIYEQFPEAEIVRPDGSRKKLSDIFRAPEKKSTTEIFFQGTRSFQQLSFHFGNDLFQRGTT
jgi:hypothetical protein